METVTYTRETLPELTEAQKRELKRLSAMTDDDIDTSDIPELVDVPPGEVKRGAFYRPMK